MKDYREKPDLLEPLPEYNYRLAQVGAILISHRARYLKALEQAASGYHSAFSAGKETMTLVYRTVSTVEDRLPSGKPSSSRFWSTRSGTTAQNWTPGSV